MVEVFRKAGAEPRDVAVEAEAAPARLSKPSGGLAYLSSAMLDLLARAEREASGGTVSVEHLLNALSQEIRGAAAIVLQAFALGPGSFRPHMAALKSVPREPSYDGASDPATRFTQGLVARAKGEGFGPIIGRDVEMRRLLQVLERRGKNHPLLVGEPGVGKSTIVGALAARIAAGDVPQNLSTLALVELEVGSLTAGAKLRGEIEERLKQTLASIKGVAGVKETVLFVNGLDSLLGQGNVGGGVGDMLKPLLARGEVRLLGTTTPEGLRKINDKDPALLRRFTVLTIDPPTPDQAIEILRGIATRFEKHHNVRIGDPAVVAAVRLAKRYVQDKALPDSAIDLLDEAAARKRVEIDGVPADVDNAIRRLSSLKAQRTGLADDADAMSTKTRDRLDKEIASLEPQVSELRAKIDSRRGMLAPRRRTCAKSTKKLTRELEDARKAQSFARLGELEHVTMPDVKRRLDAADAAVAKEGVTDIPNIVGEEAVADVLGDWTGIPVAKMLESEADKLLKMEERLAKRVVGQDEAVRAVSRAVRRGRVGLRDPGRPIGSFLYPRPERRRKDRAREGARGVPLRRRAVADASRHERVHGEAHGRASARLAAGLRRQRRRRLPHRGRSPPTVLRDLVRRGRKGARGRLQPSPPGSRRRPVDRWLRSHGRLLEHGRHHDEQHWLASASSRPT